jgi:ABC-2 type transport system permease protein
MDILWYLSHVLVFEILFLHTPSIAGWAVTDVRVFLGFVFVSDGFMMVWLGQAWHFGRELKDGVLDPVRVRPISPIFLYFFQRFSLEGSANMLIALGYLGYAVAMGPGFTPESVGMLAWGVALACWSRVVLTVFFSTWEFYVLHSDLSAFTHEMTMAGADRPLDIFDRRVRVFLLFLLPVGALSHFPASMVLGRYGAVEAGAYSAWMAAFGLWVFWFWRRSFRRYESAMG